MTLIDLVPSILIDGIAYAMILFMIAVGLSLSLGLMHVVNMAHGAFAMLGGFGAITLVAQFDLPFWLAVILAILVAMAVAALLEIALIRRIYRRSELDQALLTIGIAFVFIAAINLLSGADLATLKLPPALSGSADLGFRTLPVHRIAVIVLGILVAGLLWLGIERSRFGIRLRAAVDNAPIAGSVGIDTGRIYTFSFALGGGLAALGGIAGAELLPMEPTYALKYIVLFLAVVAVGGHGTLFGSFLAALLLGLIDTAAKYLVPELSYIAFFVTMLVVLALRPQGLLGRAA